CIPHAKVMDCYLADNGRLTGMVKAAGFFHDRVEAQC
ncbi:hypothetical protein LCGC14_2947000, partial [marine sediment metagenome]